MNFLENKLQRVLKKVIKGLGLGDAGAALFLLKSREMVALKKKFYPSWDGETADVLSFREPSRFPHPERKGGFLGEIYLNVDLASKDFERAIFLLIHGFLHLLGYDHKKKRDIIRMQRKEIELGKRLGIDIRKFY